MATEAVNQYFRDILELNPLEDDEKIILERNKFVGIFEEKPLFMDRQKITHHFKTIRKMMWTMPVDKVKRRIELLRFENHPDLGYTAEKFLKINENKSKLDGLLPPNLGLSGLGAVLDFQDLFKKILIAKPCEVYGLKDKATLVFIRNRIRIQPYIKNLKKNAPELYDIERDWLTWLLSYNPLETSDLKEDFFDIWKKPLSPMSFVKIIFLILVLKGLLTIFWEMIR